MKAPDYDTYFKRIGYGGAFAPTLEVLTQIHALHAASIPFENLSAFLGEPVKLDLASLEEKLLRQGRGGWCFEQNVLLWHVLRGIGFKVKPLAARVRWNVAPTVISPRSHMLLHVTLAQGPHIADVGFGGLSLTAPLRLAAGVEQPTPHERFRLVASDERFVLETRLPDDWQPLYVFDLYEQQMPDFEVSNWYLANHPQSQFVNGVIAARAGSDRRYALRNTRYAVHHANGETERRELASAAQIREILAGPMGIRLPDAPRLDEKLEAMIRSTEASR